MACEESNGLIMGGPKNMLQLMAAIAATGAILNLMNSGTFGTSAAAFSNYITRGFGAGAL